MAARKWPMALSVWPSLSSTPPKFVCASAKSGLIIQFADFIGFFNPKQSELIKNQKLPVLRTIPDRTRPAHESTEIRHYA